jgi:hypothetical protein
MKRTGRRDRRQRTGRAPQANKHGRPVPNLDLPVFPTRLLRRRRNASEDGFEDGLPRHSGSPCRRLLLQPTSSAIYFFCNLPGALLEATRPCSGCVMQDTRCSLYLCQSDRRYPRAPVVEAGAPPGVQGSAPLRLRMSRRAAIPVQPVDLCAERRARVEEVTHGWTSAKDTCPLRSPPERFCPVGRNPSPACDSDRKFDGGLRIPRTVAETFSGIVRSLGFLTRLFLPDAR